MVRRSRSGFHRGLPQPIVPKLLAPKLLSFQIENTSQLKYITYFEQLQQDRNIQLALGASGKRVVFQENDSPKDYGGVTALALSENGLEGLYGNSYRGMTPEQCADYIHKRGQNKISVRALKREVQEGIEKLFK